jgi:hypothetical protein
MPRWRTWSAGRRAVTVGLMAAGGLVVLGIAFVELPGMVVDHDIGARHVATQDRLTWPPVGPSAPAADAPIDSVVPLDTRATDSQLALRCLGVLCYQYDRPDPWLNLSLTDLRRADFDGLWLPRVNLDRARMQASTLFGANLTSASLVSANLDHASLRRADLTEARCVLADFQGAGLVEAVLDKAVFTKADLRGANLRKVLARHTVLCDADLRGADLRGADLSSADFAGAGLEAAVASDRTRWPDTFDLRAAGVTVEADPGPEPPPLLQPPVFD